MFCKHCGKENGSDSVFCENCGLRLYDAEAADGAEVGAGESTGVEVGMSGSVSQEGVLSGGGAPTVFCMRCGNEVSGESIFCDNCGFRVSDASQPNVQSVPPGGASPVNPWPDSNATVGGPSPASAWPDSNATVGGPSSANTWPGSAATDSVPPGGASPVSPWHDSNATVGGPNPASAWPGAAATDSMPPGGASPANPWPGDAAAAAPPDAKPPKRSSLVKKIAIVIGGVAVLAIAVFLVFSIVNNSGRNFIYTTVKNSQKAYSKELDRFVSRNPVLNEIRKKTSSSYTQRIQFPGGRMTVSNDSKAKILYSEVRMDYPDIRGRAYITDSKLIAGVPSVAYIEANPKAIGSDIQAFLDNVGGNVSFEISQETIDTLDGVDLSYSGLTGLSVLDDKSEYVQLFNRYSDVVKKLVEKAGYEKGTSEVEIGGKTVKTDMFTLTCDSKIVGDWLKNDVLPAVRNDRLLQKYFKMIYDFNENLRPGSSDYEFEDFLIDFEDWIQDIVEEMEWDRVTLTLRGKVYKGVIVAVELTIRSDSLDGDNVYSISALGEDYRLNNISVEFNDGWSSEPLYFRMEGDHIGAEVVTSNISYKLYNRMDRQRASFEWNTKETSNNLRIRIGGDSMRITAALDGKEVIVKYDDFTWRLGELEESIELPGNTVAIRDVTMDSLMELFGDMF